MRLHFRKMFPLFWPESFFATLFLMSLTVSPKLLSVCTPSSFNCSWNSALSLSVDFSQKHFQLHFLQWPRICFGVPRNSHIKPDIRAQMWWQEDRDPGVRETGVPLPVDCHARGFRREPQTRQPRMGSSSDEDETYNRCRVAKPWVSSSSQLPPPPDERIPTTDAYGSLTGFRRVDCPLRFRIVEALSSYREDHRDWCGAWRTHQSCSSSRRAILISHLFTDCEPTPEFSGSVASPVSCPRS